MVADIQIKIVKILLLKKWENIKKNRKPLLKLKSYNWIIKS